MALIISNFEGFLILLSETNTIVYSILVIIKPPFSLCYHEQDMSTRPEHQL
jgi:hypothetical protein